MTGPVTDPATAGWSDPTWPLAEEVDRQARTPGLPPDPGLLTALSMWLTDDVVAALLESLGELCVCAEAPVAEHYADHLLALAETLEPDDARAVRAAVDVSTAELYVRTGRPDEARRRASRCGADLAELLPGLLGDREYVLGCLADAAGRPGEAHAYAARARDLFAADGRWDEAALASEAAAAAHEGLTPAAVADWRRAAELHTAAGATDDARDCAGQPLLKIGEHGARLAVEAGATEVFSAAADLARCYGLTVPAARVDLLAAATMVDAGAPFEEVAGRIDGCRRVLTAPDLPPDERRLDEARLDLVLGRACVEHSRWTEAERRLAVALPVLQVQGTPGDVEVCEEALHAVATAMGGGAPGESANHGMRLLVEGLGLAREGRRDDAFAHLDRARDVAAGSDPYLTAFVDAAVGLLWRAVSDLPAARAALARVEAHVAEAQGRIPLGRRIGLTAVAGLLRAEIAGLAGRDAEQLAGLAATETELLALGAGAGAAQLAVRRARVLLDGGRPREALDVGLPATLALDALRCGLPDAHRRSLWAARVADGFETAFRAAAACRDTVLIAELLEVVRGNAVPLPRAPDDRTDAVSALSAAMAPQPSWTPGAVRPGPAAVAGGEERTALGLPASVRTPWGTVALNGPLEAARRYVDPVRAPLTVDWRVDEQGVR